MAEECIKPSLQWNWDLVDEAYSSQAHEDISFPLSKNFNRSLQYPITGKLDLEEEPFMEDRLDKLLQQVHLWRSFTSKCSHQILGHLFKSPTRFAGLKELDLADPFSALGFFSPTSITAPNLKRMKLSGPCVQISRGLCKGFSPELVPIDTDIKIKTLFEEGHNLTSLQIEEVYSGDGIWLYPQPLHRQ